MAGDRGEGGGSRSAPRHRARFRVNVACREWPHVERLVTANASRGGLFIRSDRVAAVGAPVDLSVELPDGSKLALRGSVIHVVAPEAGAASGATPGFGVRLDPAHGQDLVLLESMAQAAAGATSADVPAVAARPEVGVAVTADRPPVVIARIAPARSERESADAPCTGELVFGIDYGTTYSSIAMVRDGRAFAADRRLHAHPDGAGGGRTLLRARAGQPRPSR